MGKTEQLAEDVGKYKKRKRNSGIVMGVSAAIMLGSVFGKDYIFPTPPEIYEQLSQTRQTAEYLEKRMGEFGKPRLTESNSQLEEALDRIYSVRPYKEVMAQFSSEIVQARNRETELEKQIQEDSEAQDYRRRQKKVSIASLLLSAPAVLAFVASAFLTNWYISKERRAEQAYYEAEREKTQE